MKLINSFWFDRFLVSRNNLDLVFSDRLTGFKRIINISDLDINWQENDKTNFFAFGFSRGLIEPLPSRISDSSKSLEDLQFWQFPCVTEKIAYVNHASLEFPKRVGDTLNFYIGLPWATYIDKKLFPEFIISTLKTRINGIRGALGEVGLKFKLHTVCQHIYWEQCVAVWQALGVTDSWLSHMPSKAEPDLKFTLHPWSLYAVNAEDPARQVGLVPFKAPSDKSLLASFIGAHADHYISDIRLRLKQFEVEPDFLIKVTEKWHFEDVVYKHQVAGLSLEDNYSIDSSVNYYNQILSDSKFALCPSGAGPNSLRLWEALAIGSIPVLMGNFPVMPTGGSLEEINWDKIVIEVNDADLANLPTRLRAITLGEISERQERGRVAYEMVKAQRCF
jgi:hypothetical protein